jgi:hypothetical protein
MLRTFTLLLFTFLAFASNVYAGAPKLTLIFSGNTEAEVRDCPT